MSAKPLRRAAVGMLLVLPIGVLAAAGVPAPGAHTVGTALPSTLLQVGGLPSSIGGVVWYAVSLLIGAGLAGGYGYWKYNGLVEEREQTDEEVREQLEAAFELLDAEPSEKQSLTGLADDLADEIRAYKQNREDDAETLLELSESAEEYRAKTDEGTIAYKTLDPIANIADSATPLDSVESGFDALVTHSDYIADVESVLAPVEDADVPSSSPETANEFGDINKVRELYTDLIKLKVPQREEGTLVSNLQRLTKKLRTAMENYKNFWRTQRATPGRSRSTSHPPSTRVEDSDESLPLEEAKDVRDSRSPTSTIAQNLLAILSGDRGRNGLDAVLKQCVDELDTYETWRTRIERADDVESLSRRLEDLQADVSELPEPSATILRNRADDLENSVISPLRSKSDGGIEAYGAHQELRLLEDLTRDFRDSLLSPSDHERSAGENSAESEIERLREQYINNESRSKYNHFIPSKFIELAEELVGRAESADSDDAEQAYREAARMTVEWVETLYQKREYNTLLEDLGNRGY